MSASSSIRYLATTADAVAVSNSDYLESLPSKEWSRPSDCAGWTVAGVVAHLVLVEALLSSSITRGLAGDAGPPPQAVDGLGAWRAYRAREVARLSELPPANLLIRFRGSIQTMRESIDLLAERTALTGHGWHPWAVQPLAWFPGQWLVELALHDWDMRVSLDPTAEIRQAALPALGAEMRSRAARCFNPEAAAGLRGIIRIQLDGPTPISWLFRAADQGLDVLDAGTAEPNVTIQTDPGSYALVQTSRRPASYFAQIGRWHVLGDVALAERLAQAFRGY